MTKVILTCLFLCVRLSSLLAQEAGSISGKVLDEKGEPMIGVIVMDEESKQAVQTDLEGNYKIPNVKEGDHTVSIKFIGFAPIKKKVTVKAGESVALGSLKMEESSKQLKEVVVVGYGTTIKREVTGSIAKVSSKDLENVQVSSFDAALQGRAAGLQVVQSSGVAGAGVRVRIRGQASISGSADPLYVIDGVPVNNGDFGSKSGGVQSQSINPLSAMNPNDIESVEVLKDAAAGAIYGARAANGVILITTKRGKAGKAEFNFSYNNGITTPTKVIKYLDAEQYQRLYMEAYRNDSAGGGSKVFPTTIERFPITKASFMKKQFTDGTAFGNTNWFDEVLQTGKTQDVNLTARGGNEKVTYFLGGGFNDNQGMLKGNAFQRISGRANVDAKATDKLTIGTQIGLYSTSNDQVATSYSGGYGAAQSFALPIYPVYNANGSFFGTQLSKPSEFFDTYKLKNPVAQRENKANTSTFRSLTNLYLEYKLLPSLTFRTEGGLDYMDQFETWYYAPVNRYYNNKPFGAFSERRSIVLNFNNNNILTYTKTFKEKHKITVLGGMALQAMNQTDLGFTTRDVSGFADPYFKSSISSLVFHEDAIKANVKTPLNGSQVDAYNSRDFYRFASYFTRINYVLNSKYIAQVSLRADGSSRFGANHRYGYFPAVSASWIASDEKFMQSVSWINLLKLRTSYGLTGNSEVGNFAWLGTYSPKNGYMGNAGSAPNRLANPDLTWESTKQFDAGFDFGVLNDRITGTFGYYYKLGTDILLKRPVQQSATGLGNLVVNSDVVIANYGIEFSLTSHNLTKKLIWNTDFNIYFNRNKVIDAAGIPKDFDAGPGDARIIEGQPVGISLLAPYAGVNPQTGYDMYYNKSGEKVDLSPKANKVAFTDSRVQAGSPYPKFAGGINNSFEFMNFDLSFLFVFSYGNTIYDDGGKVSYGQNISEWNQREETLNRWQKPGDVTDVAKLSLNPFDRWANNTTKFLYDGSYLRLRTLSLGYKLPQSLLKRVKLNTARVFIMGQNLWLLTKYPGSDPEVVRYSDDSDSNQRNNQSNVAFAAPYLPTPQARTITIGINIGF